MLLMYQVAKSISPCLEFVLDCGPLTASQSGLSASVASIAATITHTYLCSNISKKLAGIVVAYTPCLVIFCCCVTYLDDKSVIHPNSL